MKSFWLWLEDQAWIGVIDSYDAIHATDREANHEQIWPTIQKRWRYRPGTGLCFLWWDADEEEKYNITQWVQHHGGGVNRFINI